jgi:hypothetical protein
MELGGTVYTVGAFRPVLAQRRRRLLVLSGAAVVLLLMLGAALWAFGPTDTPDRAVAASAGPPAVPVETVAETAATAAPVIPSPPRSVRATRSASTSSASAAAPVPSESPAAGRTTVLAESFNVTAYVTTRCDGASWTQLVSATSSAELTAATVTWTGPDGVSRSQAMLVSGQYAATEVRGLQVATAAWVVRATAADGRGGASDSGTVARPC